MACGNQICGTGGGGGEGFWEVVYWIPGPERRISFGVKEYNSPGTWQRRQVLWVAYSISWPGRELPGK